METFINAVIAILPSETRDIDPILLSIVLTKESLNPEIKEYYREKFGEDSYDRFEFLGDGVLELIIKRLLFYQVPNGNPYVLTNALYHLRSNKFFACLAQDKLCKLIPRYEVKQCADFFEALFGLLFIYLETKDDDAIGILYNWALEYWEFDHYLSDYLENKPNPCFLSGYKLNFNQRNLMGLLTQLNKEELDRVYRKLGRIHASQIGVDPRTNLNNFYIKERLGGVIYLEGDKSGEVIIPCPPTVCPETEILARGYGPTLNESRKDAAEKAIVKLQSLGYSL